MHREPNLHCVRFYIQKKSVHPFTVNFKWTSRHSIVGAHRYQDECRSYSKRFSPHLDCVTIVRVKAASATRPVHIVIRTYTACNLCRMWPACSSNGASSRRSTSPDNNDFYIEGEQHAVTSYVIVYPIRAVCPKDPSYQAETHRREDGDFFVAIKRLLFSKRFSKHAAHSNLKADPGPQRTIS